MLNFFTNGIVTHVFAALAGAGCAWYASHKTTLRTAAATVSAMANVLKTDLSTVKKDIG